jgi:surface antigen
MRAKVYWGLVWGAVLMTFLTTPSRRAGAGNCALYARAQTGVFLFGAAGGWWDEAAGRYQRGQVPAVGSILVFRRTGHIPSGHVAVVDRVVSSREIVVNHANWYHGMVTRAVTVIDDSPNNDWSAVAVMDLDTGKFGRDNPTYGFVYPETGPRETAANAGTYGLDPYFGATRASYEPSRHSGLLHFTVATSDRHGGTRHHRTARHQAHHRGGPAHAVHFSAVIHAHGRGAESAGLAPHSYGFAVHADRLRDPAHPETTRRGEATRYHQA